MEDVTGKKWQKKHDTAVVLHLYYPEIVDEIFFDLDNLGREFDLYATIPFGGNALVKKIRERFKDARIFMHQNLGRDILPFLNVLRIIFPLNYSVMLKLHSKMTPHREDGASWRSQVFERLIGSSNQIDVIKAAFGEDPTIGMIGPIGHVLNSHLYMGQNQKRINELISRTGLSTSLPESFYFVGSTMFWCRPGILEPLINANFTRDDFESEPLPADGTTVHAIERLFGLVTAAQGYCIKEVNHAGEISNPDPFHIFEFASTPTYLRLRNIKKLTFFRAYDKAYAIEYLRITAPFREAGIEVIQGIVDGVPDLEKIKEGDAVIFQREFPRNQSLYYEVVRTARSEGKFLIYEMDDLLFDLPENHPERKSEVYTQALIPMLSALVEADLVVVPTKKLLEIYKGFNPNIVVVPNYLDDNIWHLESPELKAQDIVTIGYMGSNSHTPDLELIAPALAAIAEKYKGRFKLIVWGTPLPDGLKSFSWVEWQPSPTNVYVDFAKFFQTQNADIFIAPLADNLFNACKSPLKFLEYTARGAPGVYSDVTPYQIIVEDGVDGFLAASQDEWIKALEELINNPSLRKQMAEAAQVKVRSQWLLSRNAPNWPSIIETLPANEYQEFGLRLNTIHLMTTVKMQVEQMQYNLRQQLSNSETQNQALTEHMHELESQVIEGLEQKAVLAEEHRSLREKLTAQITDLETQNQALTEHMHELESQVASKLAEIDTLKQENLVITEANLRSGDRIRELLEEVDSLDEQAHYWSGLLRKSSAEFEQRIRDLTLDLAQQKQNLTDAQAELNRISSSTAWKTLTSIRKTGSGLSEVTNHLKTAIRPVAKFTGEISINHDRKLIETSGFFDEEFYLSHNMDVKNAKVEPIKHFLRHGGVEGRAPSEQFDSTWYLNQYPDVKHADINPLLHYLKYGKAEGRLIMPLRSEALPGPAAKTNKNMDQVAHRSLVPDNLILEPELIELLEKALRSKFQLSLSHDDYLTITGGAQVYINDEQRKLNDAAKSYVHVFPFSKGRNFQADDRLLFIGINLDGNFIGYSEINELGRALGKLKNQYLETVNIHHTMGFTYNGIQRLLDISGNRGVFWLHDYFSLCPSYNLLRNDTDYCGAPEINSNACTLCNYLSTRKIQSALFEKLFTSNLLEIAAPSRFTYELWQERFPIKGLKAHIIPPARLEWQPGTMPGYRSGTLRVGFLGYPLKYKGWETWKDLTSEFYNDKRYKFFHFSTQDGGPGNYKLVQTRVTKEDRMAMIDALQHYQIDVVILWSKVAETFSFTLHEALAAGAFILTNPQSGNIQDYLRKNPSKGLVLENDSALLSIFESGKIIQAVSDSQREGKTQANLIIGGLKETDL